ncbi:hypothetical protein ACVGWG_04395 [Enterobacter asburiae]
MNNTVIACVDGCPSTPPLAEKPATAPGKLLSLKKIKNKTKQTTKSLNA